MRESHRQYRERRVIVNKIIGGVGDDMAGCRDVKIGVILPLLGFSDSIMKSLALLVESTHPCTLYVLIGKFVPRDHRARASRRTLIAVAIALLKTGLHNIDTVLNNRTPNLLVVVIIVVDSIVNGGILEDLARIDLAGEKFGRLRSIGMTDIVSGGVSIDTLKVFGPGDIAGDARLKIQFLEILECLMKVRLRHSQILYGSYLGFCIDGVSEGYHGLEMLRDGIEKRNLRILMLVDRIGIQGGMGLRDEGTGARRFQYVCAV